MCVCNADVSVVPFVCMQLSYRVHVSHVLSFMRVNGRADTCACNFQFDPKFKTKGEESGHGYSIPTHASIHLHICVGSHVGHYTLHKHTHPRTSLLSLPLCAGDGALLRIVTH